MTFKKILSLILACCMLMAVLSLTACGGNDAPAPADGGSDASADTTLDAAAFDALVTSGPVANEDAIASSEWAKRVKDAGKLRVGGVETSTLFSQLAERNRGRTEVFTIAFKKSTSVQFFM